MFEPITVEGPDIVVDGRQQPAIWVIQCEQMHPYNLWRVWATIQQSGYVTDYPHLKKKEAVEQMRRLKMLYESRGSVHPMNCGWMDDPEKMAAHKADLALYRPMPRAVIREWDRQWK